MSPDWRRKQIAEEEDVREGWVVDLTRWPMVHEGKGETAKNLIYLSKISHSRWYSTFLSKMLKTLKMLMTYI